VDRHLPENRNKAAFIWVPEREGEDTRTITYQELYARVNEFAALLRDVCHLKAGDRVTIHMPMVPELPVAMLACARLGVIHSVVFGGFSGHACGERIVDSRSHVLVTIDAYHRNGELIDQKLKTDQAVEFAADNGVTVDPVSPAARRGLGVAKRQK
jgi:acetyl-CoA synthetase